MSGPEWTSDDGAIRIAHCDALEYLRSLPDSSVDALVTDPPAGIGFMGKEWDKDKGGRDAWIAWLAEIMREALRVLKPGAHGLVWALPRTSHWTGMALEDAGFDVRDMITHLFGTGFPKSLDVSKAIDRHMGCPRDVQGSGPSVDRTALDYGGATGKAKNGLKGTFVRDDVARTEAARQWDGWGTALKPGAENWWLVRKPLVGTVAANVQEHGTGAINVDGCRIGTTGGSTIPSGMDRYNERLSEQGYRPSAYKQGAPEPPQPAGRWPSNVTLDEHAARLLDEQAGERTSGVPSGVQNKEVRNGYDAGFTRGIPVTGYGDTGGASRFFYVAKPTTAEREANLYGFDKASAADLVDREDGSAGMQSPRAGAGRTSSGRANTHPTVKSVALMRWLIRLITPPGGLVLDCFLGSGTTGIAAKDEGMRFVGCEQEQEWYEVARARIGRHMAQVRLL